jgi:hypothetical protein
LSARRFQTSEKFVERRKPVHGSGKKERKERQKHNKEERKKD